MCVCVCVCVFMYTMIRGMKKWSNSEIRIKINYPLHLFTYRSIFFSYYDAHLKFYFGGKVCFYIVAYAK